MFDSITEVTIENLRRYRDKRLLIRRETTYKYSNSKKETIVHLIDEDGVFVARFEFKTNKLIGWVDYLHSDLSPVTRFSVKGGLFGVHGFCEMFYLDRRTNFGGERIIAFPLYYSEDFYKSDHNTFNHVSHDSELIKRIITSKHLDPDVDVGKSLGLK